MPRKVNSKNPPVASEEEDDFQGVPQAAPGDGVLMACPASMGNATSVTEVTIASLLQPRALGELPPTREEAGAASPQRSPMEEWQELWVEVGRLSSMVALLGVSVGAATSRTEVAVDKLLT
ncbi:unnamed protein product [Lampetra planeri]